MKEQEKIREWMAKFDLVRKEEVKVRNEAEQIKNIQRDLVNKIQNVIKRKPDIVKQIEQTEGTDFSEEIKIMNSVEKTASKEELIIKEIYRKSRSNWFLNLVLLIKFCSIYYFRKRICDCVYVNYFKFHPQNVVIQSFPLQTRIQNFWNLYLHGKMS